MSRRGSEGTPQIEDLRREEMLTPDEVAAMLGLRGLGWGAKRIAAEFGCNRNTVKRYLGLGGWARCRRPERAKALDGLSDWLADRRPPEAERAGNHPLAHPGGVLQAQDVAHLAHRQSLGWHGAPRMDRHGVNPIIG